MIKSIVEHISNRYSNSNFGILIQVNSHSNSVFQSLNFDSIKYNISFKDKIIKFNNLTFYVKEVNNMSYTNDIRGMDFGIICLDINCSDFSKEQAMLRLQVEPKIILEYSSLNFTMKEHNVYN